MEKIPFVVITSALGASPSLRSFAVVLIDLPSFKVSNSALLKEVSPKNIVASSNCPVEAEIVVHNILPNDPVDVTVRSVTVGLTKEPVPSLRVPPSVYSTLW